jgi:uncharacterized membrane protein
VTFTSPAALWLLLAIPLVWLAHLVARTKFNPRQRFLQAAVRSLLLASIAFALARPVLSMPSSRLSIVYAVDVSHSVSTQAIETAARRIDELTAALRPVHVRVVAFGKTAARIEGTDALRRLAALQPGAAAPVDRSGTDLEQALAAARAELAPGHVPRVVLFSDGRPTAGDIRTVVARLAADRIPLSVEPLPARSLGDAWVDALTFPDRISAGATFKATVRVGAQREVPALVELLADDGRALANSRVTLKRGTTDVALETVLATAGASVLRAAITVEGDPLTAGNTLDEAVWVYARSKVLYVEGTPSSARYLATALTGAGFDVAVRPAAGLPSTPDDLDPWDVVILSDVPRKAIRDASMSALTNWVEQRGGGLLVAGGESVFGEGGYRRSPIERLTPVTFERRDEPEVALVLVLDRSWSMAGTSMELCKAAAQAAVDVLTDEQSIGILTFNDAFNWDVPLRNVGRHRDDIRGRIAAIGPGGHTLIYPAIEQAYNALRNASARAKHVVLLSDGRSYPADYESLVRQMADARITVSSIAVGPAADPELLGSIAKWGKGRYYAVLDAKELPQIFVKEAKNAATPAFDEKVITPIVKTPAFLAGMDLTRLPPLKGRTATVLKDTALEVIASNDEDPLLAFWAVGLGRTAVFASDVKDRWAAEWVRWRGYGPFFSAVIRALERRRPPAAALELDPGPVRGDIRSIRVALEARDSDGGYRDLLRPAIQVRGGNDRPVDAVLRQTTPGRYETRIVAAASQPLTVTLAGADAGITSRIFVPDVAAEYRLRPPDDVLLRSMASATGGAWSPTPALLAGAAGDRRTSRRPLAPLLLAIALVLWFVDLLFRRVRVFEGEVPG